MFLKERPYPQKILQLEALRRRVLNKHSKRKEVEQELYRRKAGLWGELEVDKKLKRLDQEKYYILCDLRLPNGDGTYFQIDTLILSASFFLIVEAKNISGTLYFDLVNHQFYRINDDGKKESFADPVSQARLHSQQLRQWLMRHKFPPILIDFIVSLTNPYSVFHISPTNHPFTKKICALAGLTWEIDNLEEHYKKEILTEKDLRKISKALLKSHTPPQPSEILQQYGISIPELQTGVHCPNCEYLPLTYQVGKWHCPVCKKFYKDAYIYALNDYFLLVSPTITNSEFRKFLRFDNPAMATKILKGMNLQVSGTNKGRFYQKV